MKNKLKIGIVCYPTYGGSGVVATELGNSLASQGHEVHFITYDVPVRLDELNPNIYFHQVNVSDYPLFDYPPYELVLSSKLVDVVKHEFLDVLHVHYAIPHASAAYMAKQILKKEGIIIPFVTTLHGTDITLVGKDRSFEPVITFAINESDAVTAVSDSLKEDTLAHFDIEKEIKVVHNFICPSEYDIDLNEALKTKYAPNDEKILIHISNFRKVKRIEDIVKSFNLIKTKVNAKLLLVGDGPERGNIEELCRELHLCNDVHFVGKVKSTKEILSIADIFLLASKHESFGLSALEAMASKTAVVSTNSGGIPEVNIEGVTGFLNDVGDVEKMAKNILHILTDDKLLSKMKLSAFNRSQLFSVNKIVPKYEEIYREVIRTKSLF